VGSCRKKFLEVEKMKATIKRVQPDCWQMSLKAYDTYCNSDENIFTDGKKFFVATGTSFSKQNLIAEFETMQEVSEYFHNWGQE